MKRIDSDAPCFDCRHRRVLARVRRRREGSQVRADLGGRAHPPHRQHRRRRLGDADGRQERRRLRHRPRSPEMGRRDIASGRRAVSRPVVRGLHQLHPAPHRPRHHQFTRRQVVPRLRQAHRQSAGRRHRRAARGAATTATSASCAAPTAPATSSSSRAITATRCGRARIRRTACSATYPARLELI